MSLTSATRSSCCFAVYRHGEPGGRAHRDWGLLCQLRPLSTGGPWPGVTTWLDGAFGWWWSVWRRVILMTVCWSGRGRNCTRDVRYRTRIKRAPLPPIAPSEREKRLTLSYHGSWSEGPLGTPRPSTMYAEPPARNTLIPSSNTRKPRTTGSSAASQAAAGWIRLVLYSACLLGLGGGPLVAAFDCDFIRISSDGYHAKNGTFTAPQLNGHTIPPYGLQCIYTFIALPTERVKVDFTHFNLAGRPPDCVHEYIDLYTELRNASEDLVQTDKFGGRFCGRIGPRPRISLYNTIVLVFSIDRPVLTSHLFSGTYEFIAASKDEMGSPVPPSSCDFVVRSAVRNRGNFVSPMYPGVYPQRIMCSYQFLGQPGQRVRLEFMDFDVFSGGAHCPYDRVIIYDGPTEQAEVIQTYCGGRREIIVYSSQESLFVSFITNRSGGENRGFLGIFYFSNRYVKLDFITGEHVRGTECDQRILSTGRSSGLFTSPNWPLIVLPNVDCKYLIEGLNDADNLERVQLRVVKLDMPQFMDGREDNCSAGGLKIWLNGRDDRPPNYVLCGSRISSEVMESTESMIQLNFSSGTTEGTGFQMQYHFETYFAVPGTPHPVTTKCEFLFNSAGSKAGEFHSPRHPANYPSNNNCTYIFEGADDEQAHLEFDQFRLSGPNGYTANTCDGQDSVLLFEVERRGARYSLDVPIGQYCGVATPAPMKSRFGRHSLKMLFLTDGSGVTNGFRGRYWFDTERPPYDPTRGCGGNITNMTYGVIMSPSFEDGTKEAALRAKYPSNLDCEWLLTVRPGHNVLMNVTYLSLEGSQNFQTCTGQTCGCAGAALKIFPDVDLYPSELCGDRVSVAPKIPNQGEFKSHTNVMKLIFTSASKAVGAAGFKITWNEFHYPLGPRCETDEFLCDNSRYCISREGVCDEAYNCGENDTSDEGVRECGDPADKVSFFANQTVVAAIAAGAAGLVLVIVAVVVCVCRRRRQEARRRKRQETGQDQHNDWNS